MLRYTTDSGVVAFYDIQPGNGAVYSYNPGTRTGSHTLESNTHY